MDVGVCTSGTAVDVGTAVGVGAGVGGSSGGVGEAAAAPGVAEGVGTGLGVDTEGDGRADGRPLSGVGVTVGEAGVGDGVCVCLPAFATAGDASGRTSGCPVGLGFTRVGVPVDSSDTAVGVGACEPVTGIVVATVVRSLASGSGMAPGFEDCPQPMTTTISMTRRGDVAGDLRFGMVNLPMAQSWNVWYRANTAVTSSGLSVQLIVLMDVLPIRLGGWTRSVV